MYIERWTNFGDQHVSPRFGHKKRSLDEEQVSFSKPSKSARRGTFAFPSKALTSQPDTEPYASAPASVPNAQFGGLFSSVTINNDLDRPLGAPRADATRKWNFDGVGRDDMIFRRSNSNTTVILATNATRYNFGAFFIFRLLNVADYNNDGLADLLLSDMTIGELRIKYTTASGGIPTPGLSAVPTIFDTFATVSNFASVFAGFGDFNGDGIGDSIRRDPNASNRVSLQLLNLSTANGTTESTLATNVGLGWSLAGTGDINGDGRDDLIWRNTDNTVLAWLMNSAGTFTSVNLASVGHEWRLEAVTRLEDGDTFNDLLWRNVVSGRTIGWIMGPVSGASIVSVAEFGTFAFDLEYVTTLYGTLGNSTVSGDGPQLIWRRTDGATIGTYILSATSVSETLVAYPSASETHFRSKVPDMFSFSARGMWGPYDVLEPMRTRNFGGMGASGGSTGRIPIIDSGGGISVLYGTGGGLAVFTPTPVSLSGFSERQLIVVGMGDFNNDGIGIDLLYRKSDNTAGAFVARWNAATGTYVAGIAVQLGSGGLNPDGRVIGMGQINLTTIGEEIVSQTSDGLVTISSINANASGIVLGSSTTETRIQSRDWIGQGVIDLDGNGIGDIVWRNAKTGSISYWSLSSATPSIVREVFINTTPVTLEWDLVGMGDLEGDGDGDLIWRRNTDGFTVAWFFTAGQLGGVSGLTGRGWDWRFEGTSDVNGDGKTDLIWRNQNGQYAADLMNGAAVTSTIISAVVGFDRATMGWNQAFMRSL